MSLLKESQHLKIPLKEIEIATKNFQLCIGKGGYGLVYKGELLIQGNLTTVAVKRLNEQFGQGLKEFLMEIQLLTGQNHPNLISLIGYCDEGKEKIIVYEYAENGSLDQYLKRNSTLPALTCLERLKICLDAARGLNHLHNHVGKHQTIIHRDIKSANILIDHRWVAKISDLGLSKLSLAGLNRSAVISHACGTQGYCEPEYFSTGIVKKESDVYSFGMVLFEVLCGRLCFVVGDDGFLLSAKSVKNYYKEKKLDEIVDPILREQMSSDLMSQFGTLAYNCLNEDRGKRPPMDLVAKEIEQILRIQLSSYPSETSVKISLSLEASYSSDVKLHKLGETFQARSKTMIEDIDLKVEARAVSFDLEKEGAPFLQKMNQEEVKVAVNYLKEIGKNRKWVKVVEDYVDANFQTLDLMISLWTCFKMARRTLLLLHEAVILFNGESGLEENRYRNVVNNLKKFKAAGNPFTQDFFMIFDFVYKRQTTFLEKLKMKTAKLKRLNQNSTMKSIFSLSKNSNNEIRWKTEVFDSLERQSYMVVRDLESIQTFVNRVQMDLEYVMLIADFAIKMEDAAKYVVENLEKQLSSSPRIMSELEERVYLCMATVQRARADVLQTTIKLPV